MGQTYIMGDGAFTPESRFVAKATFSTMPFASYGGWQPAEINPRAPRFNDTTLQGLGALPLVPLGMAAAAAAIGGLLAMVQNALDDDWKDSTVFKSHARAIHSAMLAIQCLIGGSEPGKPIIDTLGNEICKGGSPRVCTLSASQLTEWRALRDGFSRFWADTASSMFGPTNAEALRLKGYAREFYNFYAKISTVCRRQGVQLPSAPGVPDQEPPKEAPPWLKWTVVGAGIVSVAFIARLILNR